MALCGKLPVQIHVSNAQLFARRDAFASPTKVSANRGFLSHPHGSSPAKNDGGVIALDFRAIVFAFPACQWM